LAKKIDDFSFLADEDFKKNCQIQPRQGYFKGLKFSAWFKEKLISNVNALFLFA